MSLFESPSLFPENFSEPAFVRKVGTNTQQTVDPQDRLSGALDGFLLIRKREVAQGAFRGRQSQSGAIVFTGKLLDSAEALYAPIVERFRVLDYTPILE